MKKHTWILAIGIHSLALGLILFLTGCLKITDKNDKTESPPPPAPVVETHAPSEPPVTAASNHPPAPPVNEINKITPKKELISEPLRMCVRNSHYVGLKKCVRTGKWVKVSLSAQDVDNDRTDVFTEPGVSVLKENVYPDTFRIEQGIHQITNYPDQYRTNAPYGGEAHIFFAVPNQIDSEIKFSYWGRDDSFSDKVFLSQVAQQPARYVKIQHWNDRRTFKKYASLQFSLLGDYQETNYRYQCSWMESDQGLDFTQSLTKEGLANPKVPETIIWRKITERCESLPSFFPSENMNLLPFRDVSPNQLFTTHSFKNDSKAKKRIYIKNSENYEIEDTPFDLANPLKKYDIQLNGSTPLFKNYRNEEVTRLEGIYDEDLKDKGFNPQKEILLP